MTQAQSTITLTTNPVAGSNSCPVSPPISADPQVTQLGQNVSNLQQQILNLANQTSTIPVVNWPTQDGYWWVFVALGKPYWYQVSLPPSGEIGVYYFLNNDEVPQPVQFEFTPPATNGSYLAEMTWNGGVPNTVSFIENPPSDGNTYFLQCYDGTLSWRISGTC